MYSPDHSNIPSSYELCFHARSRLKPLPKQKIRFFQLYWCSYRKASFRNMTFRYLQTSETSQQTITISTAILDTRLVFMFSYRGLPEWSANILCCFANFVLCSDNFVLCFGNFVLCFGNFVLCFDNFVLCFHNFVLCFGNFELCFDNVVLCFGNFVLCFDNFVLCFDNFVLYFDNFVLCFTKLTCVSKILLCFKNCLLRLQIWATVWMTEKKCAAKTKWRKNSAEWITLPGLQTVLDWMAATSVLQL